MQESMRPWTTLSISFKTRKIFIWQIPRMSSLQLFKPGQSSPLAVQDRQTGCSLIKRQNVYGNVLLRPVDAVQTCLLRPSPCCAMDPPVSQHGLELCPLPPLPQQGQEMHAAWAACTVVSLMINTTWNVQIALCLAQLHSQNKSSLRGSLCQTRVSQMCLSNKSMS